MILFDSRTQHRVLKVKSGVRKSIVLMDCWTSLAMILRVSTGLDTNFFKDKI